LGIGDWGLGVGGLGVWAQAPNPKTPNQKHNTKTPLKKKKKILFRIKIKK